jgi:hypothetical protein
MRSKQAGLAVAAVATVAVDAEAAAGDWAWSSGRSRSEEGGLSSLRGHPRCARRSVGSARSGGSRPCRIRSDQDTRRGRPSDERAPGCDWRGKPEKKGTGTEARRGSGAAGSGVASRAGLGNLPPATRRPRPRFRSSPTHPPNPLFFLVPVLPAPLPPQPLTTPPTTQLTPHTPRRRRRRQRRAGPCPRYSPLTRDSIPDTAHSHSRLQRILTLARRPAYSTEYDVRTPSTPETRQSHVARTHRALKPLPAPAECSQGQKQLAHQHTHTRPQRPQRRRQRRQR